MSNQYEQNVTTLAAPGSFQFPAPADQDVDTADLNEDLAGLGMSLPRVKIPGGSVPQFKMPSEDPNDPTYVSEIEGVILYNHDANAYWPEGSEYDDNTPPQCQSMDGLTGHGDPGQMCAACGYNQFGSGPKGSGKACKNMRMLYILRSGEFMPLQLALPPTSLKPYRDFANIAFGLRRRPMYGSIVNIKLKLANSNGYDYSVATFRRVRDFTGDELAQATAYAKSFREMIKAMLSQQAQAQAAIAAENAASQDADPLELPDNDSHFAVGILDGERELLPA